MVNTDENNQWGIKDTLAVLTLLCALGTFIGVFFAFVTTAISPAFVREWSTIDDLFELNLVNARIGIEHYVNGWYIVPFYGLLLFGGLLFIVSRKNNGQP